MRKNLEKKGYALKRLTAADVRDVTGPVRIHLIALCHQGEMKGTANLMPIEMRAGTRVCLPHVFQLTANNISDDFRATVLGVDPRVSVDVSAGITAERFDYVFANPVRDVDEPHEWQLLNCLMDSIEHYEAVDVGDRAGGGVVHGIYRTMLLAIAEMEVRRDDGARSMGPYSMRDAWFRNFVLLLDKHIEQEREVQFYAEQVGVSPKYLTMICKDKTGRKPKEIISAILLSRIKMDMATTTLNMKQLADKYGFADMSSFGKFFKKMTGSSPRDFRMQ
ncbi:MAG: helix-turn-helix transcriptional regulator [Muribaculaceae bacterium]|nr:helix-turn-helix transcriptional regulator [Muribaculaceae bacterium]